MSDWEDADGLSNDGYVYWVQPVGELMVKIGWAKDIEKRIRTLQTGNHRKLVVLHSIAGSREMETRQQSRFSRYRAQGEWFYIAGELARFLGFTSELHPEKTLTLVEASKYLGLGAKSIRNLVDCGFVQRDCHSKPNWFTVSWLEAQIRRNAFKPENVKEANSRARAKLDNAVGAGW